MATTPLEVWHRIYADFLMPDRLAEYRATLESALDLGYRIVSVEHFWAVMADGPIDPAQRYLILRHDIDTDPQTGAAMWEIDRSLGVKGSYFFRLSTIDIDLMHAIDDGGGAASYHFEELATVAKRRNIRRGDDASRGIPEAQDLFRRHLERLRDRTGLPMRVVASHGDFVNRKLRLPNWAILVDRHFRQEVDVELEVYDDAFMRHVTSRHSDAGHLGSWFPDDAASAIGRGSPVVYLLVHPRHWAVNRRVNIRDDVRRLEEGLRYGYAPARSTRRSTTSEAHHPTGLTSPGPQPGSADPGVASSPTPMPRTATAQAHGGRAKLLVHAPATYPAEREYILDVILSDWLGLDFELSPGDASQVSIRLAGDPADRELILPDVLFGTADPDWLTERSMPSTPLSRIVGGVPARENLHELHVARGPDSLTGSLPVLFGCPEPGERALEETATGLALAVDVFGSVFFLLARYEEIAQPAADDHDRFPGFASLAAVEGFMERPLGDEYVELLWVAMQHLWPTLERRPSAFRLRLTHDVDQPWAALGLHPVALGRGVTGDLLRRHDPGLAVRRARSGWAARSGRVDDDPLDTFDLLMDTSERWGLTSTFYFQAVSPGDEFGPSYRLDDPNITRLIGRIHDRGHTLGLHGSYDSWRSSERIRAEFETLRAACRGLGFDQDSWGTRQHYLRFGNPQTWRNHELAGFEHDSTLGYADALGFRAGTSREYQVFDLLARRALSLRERPLLIMDATVFGYMGLDPDEAASRARVVVAACRRHGGDAVICYHNSSLPRERDRAVYRELIEDLARPTP